MGALHEGHFQLARTIARCVDIVVVSIFVNPTQFNDPRDYEAYAVNIDTDAANLGPTGCEILFVPTVKEIYPVGFQTSVHPGSLATFWEGEFRPGHFQGVATIVTRLFNIIAPTIAYFGEKDAQQLAIIRQ
jgi:pantoate--beta-alanine ligase